MDKIAKTAHKKNRKKFLLIRLLRLKLKKDLKNEFRGHSMAIGIGIRFWKNSLVQPISIKSEEMGSRGINILMFKIVNNLFQPFS